MKYSSEPQVLNQKTLIALSLDVGPRTTLRVIEQCKLDFKHQLIEILSAYRSKHFAELRLAAHSISGIAAMFGAEKLCSLANEVEENCLGENFAMASHNAVDVVMATLEFLDHLEKFDLTGVAQFQSAANQL
jgi:HPt (histidine-containing phosphotransfer) domain-containing protein